MRNIFLILSLVGGMTLNAQTSIVIEVDDSSKSADTTEDVLVAVDESPEYPGGNEAMLKYLQQNLKYPKDGLDSAKSGTVYVEFVVLKTGEVSNVKVVRGIKDYPSFGAEAVRVISEMPKWKPGVMHDKPVNVKMVLPVRFSLN
ncbi:MAG: energy transducer TonB [Bacteroidia bacterium]|nr:energy transducer TonB [Bacteroidia bacterium]